MSAISAAPNINFILSFPPTYEKDAVPPSDYKVALDESVLTVLSEMTTTIAELGHASMQLSRFTLEYAPIEEEKRFSFLSSSFF